MCCVVAGIGSDGLLGTDYAIQKIKISHFLFITEKSRGL